MDNAGRTLQRPLTVQLVVGHLVRVDDAVERAAQALVAAQPKAAPPRRQPVAHKACRGRARWWGGEGLGRLLTACQPCTEVLKG